MVVERKSDGFLWKVLTKVEAIKLLNAGVEIFELHEDLTESLVEDFAQIMMSENKFGLELGYEKTSRS